MGIYIMTNTEIKKLYNIVKILTSKDLSKLAKTYKDNEDTLIVKMKKKKPSTNTEMPAWFAKWNKEVYQKVPPAWFRKWDKEVYQKIPPAWFRKWDKEVFQKVIKLNNLKTK